MINVTYNQQVIAKSKTYARLTGYFINTPLTQKC